MNIKLSLRPLFGMTGVLVLFIVAAIAQADEARQSLIDAGSFRGPAADQRAYRIGDVLTVQVLETTRARSQASTDSERTTAMGLDFRSPSADYDVNLGFQGENRGGAETRRVGELSAQITVRVVAIEANGLLRISGERLLRVNREEQKIVLRGLVRPEDISAGNTVWSARVAEAEVSLSGRGVVSEAQRRSVLSRVLQWLGLS